MFMVDQTYPPVQQACSLALAVIKAAKVPDWASVPPLTHGLSDEQLALINAHPEAVALVRPGVHVPGFCDRCGRPMLHPASAKLDCLTTRDCSGTSRGTRAATKEKSKARKELEAALDREADVQVTPAKLTRQPKPEPAPAEALDQSMSDLAQRLAGVSLS